MPPLDPAYIESVIRTLVKGYPARLIPDLRQEAWLAILEAARNHGQHPEWGSWRNTIWRVARWAVLNGVDRHPHARLGPFPTPWHAPSAGVRLDAETLLDRLDAEDRLIVELRYWHGLTHAEIGVRMGVTGEAVRLRLIGALARMRMERPRS